MRDVLCSVLSALYNYSVDFGSDSYAYSYVRSHTHTYIYIYIYIHTHTHTHTQYMYNRASYTSINVCSHAGCCCSRCVHYLDMGLWVDPQDNLENKQQKWQDYRRNIPATSARCYNFSSCLQGTRCWPSLQMRSAMGVIRWGTRQWIYENRFRVHTGQKGFVGLRASRNVKNHLWVQQVTQLLAFKGTAARIVEHVYKHQWNVFAGEAGDRARDTIRISNANISEYVKCFRKRMTYTMSACVACVSAVLVLVVKHVCNVKSVYLLF